MKTLTDIIKSARKVSAPLIVITTADQQALVAKIAEAINGNAPKLSLDFVRGLCALNNPAKDLLASLRDQNIAERSQIPAEAVMILAELPAETIVFWYNIDRYLDDPIVSQGVMNLRDLYKQDGRTLIGMAPHIRLPGSLASDIVLLDDALPTDDELAEVLDNVYEFAELKAPTDEVKRKAVDAARGLSSFGAEQVYAMALTEDGIDLADAWERKKSAVNQTQGLQITRNGPEQFESLGGLEASRTFADRLFKGGKPPRAIVFLDEIEKMLAATNMDTSGVSQDFLGAWLRWMEDTKLDGMILVGPPGSGKTAYAKAVGNSHEVPTISVDLGAMKGSLVGQSEGNIREALKVIDGVASDGAFVIATCNKLDVLPPELRRRFRSGIWFFDLPSKEEREAIWKIHLEAYGLDAKLERPSDDKWTGAEIRNCCDLAWRLASTLTEAAKFIVPVSQSDPQGVKKLQDAAEGRWLDASRGGPVTMGAVTNTKTTRSIKKGSMN